VIALLVLTPLELTSFANYDLSTIFSFSNVIAWRDNSYFGPGADQKPLLMTWSLGVEEQFYIFIPLLMLVLARVGRNSRERLVFWGVVGPRRAFVRTQRLGRNALPPFDFLSSTQQGVGASGWRADGSL
jgi:peptidoglycan/LPS O-acetylase OafA/YrhL